MEKNYLSQIHVSRNIANNLYIFITINERQLLKDKARTHELFIEEELENIFDKTVSKNIFLQDSELRMFRIEDVATINNFKLFSGKDSITYFISLNNSKIQFPAKIIFNYSFKFRYYRFLDDKLNNGSSINTKINRSELYKKVVDYDESIINFDFSEVIRDTHSIVTGEIDFRKYNAVKERVVLFSQELSNSKTLLKEDLFDSDGFLIFQNIIIDGTNNILPFGKQQEMVSYFTKFINNLNDYDYQRFLNEKSIYGINYKKEEKNTVATNLQTNLSNLNLFSEDGLFKKEDTLLKKDNVPNSPNLFLAFILLNEKIYKPTSADEEKDYISFLNNSFNYPDYFFKHVLKFKLEYLLDIDSNSMHETWEEIRTDNLQNVLNSTNPVLCRISLKNKEFHDRIAYDHFLIGA